MAEPEASELDDVLRSGLTRFSESYVSNDVWVGSDSDGVVELGWLLSGEPLILRVHHPIVTVELSATHDSTTHGILAGVLDAAELGDSIRDWITRSSPALCEGTAVDSILAQIAQTTDIMKDGSQDPDAMCDGISFGIGFDAAAIDVTAVAQPREVVTPCVADD